MKMLSNLAFTFLEYSSKRLKCKRLKKAILLPETLKIIIAVICIVLLIYLAVSLYGIFIRKSEIEQARATLDAIVGKLESLEKDGDSLSYLITGPRAWNIYYFNNTDLLSSVGCGEKGCLCSCPEFTKDEDISDSPAKCIGLGGICKAVKEIKFDSVCDSVSTITTSIFGFLGNKENMPLETKNCFIIGKPPIQVYFEKTNGVARFVSEQGSSETGEIDAEITTLLNFKKDENSKPISELISEFLILYPKNPPTQEPSKEMKDVILNIKSSEKSFIESLDKTYGILKIVQKDPEKTIVTIGDTAYDNSPSVIWGLTKKYTFKHNNIEYELLFKTAN